MFSCLESNSLGKVLIMIAPLLSWSYFNEFFVFSFIAIETDYMYPASFIASLCSNTRTGQKLPLPSGPNNIVWPTDTLPINTVPYKTTPLLSVLNF